MTRSSATVPQGSEHCLFCLQSYAYEMELRCVGCDDPMCPLCVVRIRSRSICPPCSEESDAGARDVEG